MKICNLRHTCDACPSQWEGQTIHGGTVYVRYRGGRLTVHIGEIGASVLDTVKSGVIFYEGVHGDDLDGSIQWEMVEYITGLEAV
jgi:hypothetical protein